MSCSNFMISYRVPLLMLIAVGCGPIMNLKFVCLYSLYTDLTRGEWKVTSVVKDDQLGKPEESMKEKMERLFTQPTQTPTRAAEGVVSLEEQPRREGEQAKEAKEREESMRRVETFELLKKTGAPPQSVPPVPQRGSH